RGKGGRRSRMARSSSCSTASTSASRHADDRDMKSAGEVELLRPSWKTKVFPGDGLRISLGWNLIESHDPAGTALASPSGGTTHKPQGVDMAKAIRKTLVALLVALAVFGAANAYALPFTAFSLSSDIGFRNASWAFGEIFTVGADDLS